MNPLFEQADGDEGAAERADLIRVLGIDIVLDSIYASLGEIFWRNLNQVGDLGLVEGQSSVYVTSLYCGGAVKARDGWMRCTRINMLAVEHCPDSKKAVHRVGGALEVKARGHCKAEDMKELITA